MKNILLAEWSRRHYSPPLSDWTLRKMARDGEIYPPPRKRAGRWYVHEDAQEVIDARPSLVSRL